MNRKGSVRDILLVGVIFFVLVIVGFASKMIYDSVIPEFNTKLIEEGLNSTTTDAVFDKTDIAGSLFLNAIPVVNILAGLIAIVLALFIPSHPVFGFFSLLFGLINIFMTMLFSNIMWEFINTSVFSSIANNHPLLVSVIQYNTWIAAALWAILFIVIYSKRSSVEF